MKKLLITACAIFSLIFAAKAQLPYAQNFQTSMTNMPVGWDTGYYKYHKGIAPGWQFNDVWPTHGNSLWKGNVATHTYCTFVDDIDYDYTGAYNNTSGVNCYDTLRTSSFNCSASANVFLQFDYNFNNYTGFEVGTVAISTDGGATWTTAVTLPQVNDITWHNGQVFDISAQAGSQSSVMLAFCYWNDSAGVYGYYGKHYPGWGMAIDNLNVYVPKAYDVQVTSQTQSAFLQVGKAYTMSGTAFDSGSATITSMTMNYSVNGGATQSQNISGISGFSALTSLSPNWSLGSIPFTPPAVGLYTIKYWATALNGANANLNSDTLKATFMAVDSLQPRTALFEETVGQSCYYCMLAGPNVDSVGYNQAGNVNIIHYHVPYPGPPDYMYSANTGIGTFYETYYSVAGTPDGELDGQSLYPGALLAPNDFSTPYVESENAMGAPFKIKINSVTYNPSTLMYNANVTVTSYGTFSSGLIARAVITGDTVVYTQDYSADDPPSSFQPPDGTNPSGTSDYYWQFVTRFASVALDEMPSTSGTSLGAFTPNANQTLNLSWKRNHPDSYDRSLYPYDSSASEHLTVFIQADAGIATVGIPNKYVLQSASKQISIVNGVQDLTDGVDFNLYPNPTSKMTNLYFTLDQEQHLSVQMYNMLGEQVYSNDFGTMSAGDHLVNINCATFQSGVYFVRITTDKSSVTKRLVIQQ